MSMINQTVQIEDSNVEVYESPDVREDDTIDGIEYTPIEYDIPGPNISSKQVLDKEDKEIDSFMKHLEAITEAQLEGMGVPDNFGPEPVNLKYQRLQEELEVLMKEVDEIPSDEVGFDPKIKASLDLAQLKLNQMKVNHPQLKPIGTEHGTKLLDKLTQATTLLDPKNPIHLAQPSLPSAIAQKELTHATELEVRIKDLERLLGPEASRPSEVPELNKFGGSLSKVYDIMRLFSDETYLDQVITKLQTLNAELEQMVKLQDHMALSDPLLLFDEEGEYQNKVDELVALFDRLEPLVQQVPMIGSRFKALNAFHTEAEDMNLALTKLDQVTQSMLTEAERDHLQTQRIGTSLPENIQMMHDNLAYLKEQVDDVTKRMDIITS